MWVTVGAARTDRPTDWNGGWDVFLWAEGNKARGSDPNLMALLRFRNLITLLKRLLLRACTLFSVN